MTTDADITTQRQLVYGPPDENHRGIAMHWAPLLHPHAARIGRMEPLPIYTVAHMLAAVKLNRMRLIYHEDNYADIRNYLAFAQDWQQKGL